ncbi:DUF2975 domain-containing protein [Alkaliphilus pronyensis]|uniref:DUF2975 domain-containing protein n=1 Tax=Alkaliphilus pronyensis TaxID=1482732 RepID=A0A6I0EWW6_9FIRM|nr:DUF2975 domain-containing protein [Alkaliphilus pronyensis]KAB3532449.1 DUF2975 domain-containing protein [Alkaliphilus pronyensis]
MNYKPSFLKYKKMAKVVYSIVRIISWLIIILAGISLIMGLAVRFLPDNFNLINTSSKGTFALSPDNIITFRIPNEMIRGINLKPLYSTFFTGIFVVLTLTAIVLRQLLYILNNVVKGKPFDLVNAKKLFIIGCTFILGSFVIPVVKALLINKIIHHLSFDHVSTTFTISIELLFTGLLIILLSEVFHYGAYLQQEFDSTL